MDDQKLVNEEKERATMLETLNRLKEELDRCPERWVTFEDPGRIVGRFYQLRP